MAQPGPGPGAGLFGETAVEVAPLVASAGVCTVRMGGGSDNSSGARRDGKETASGSRCSGDRRAVPSGGAARAVG